MNIARFIIVSAVVGATTGACATTSSRSGSGSNSNWLAVCAKDADCTTGLECRCGLCTKPCAKTSDCSELAAGASCTPLLEGTICAGTAPTTEPSCTLPCTGDGDCSGLGAEGRCTAGNCRRVLVNRDAGGTCLDRGNEIQSRYHDILSAADTASNKTCSVDADCVAAPALSCSDHCGLPFLSKVGAAAVSSELTAFEHDLCEPYFAAGCPTPIFFCPAIGFPKCVAGTCENSTGPLPPDGGATCGERTHELDNRTIAAANAADKACTKDADCTFIYLDFRCYHACDSGPLSTAGAAALTTELDAIGAELCPAFEAAGCRMDVPSCAPLISVEGGLPFKCVGNVCTYVTGL